VGQHDLTSCEFIGKGEVVRLGEKCHMGLVKILEERNLKIGKVEGGKYGAHK